MSQEVTRQHIDQFRKSFEADPHARVAQNAVSHNDISQLTLSRDRVQDMADSFSIKLDSWSVTNQKRSGRCWLFAALNLFRVGAMKKMNLKDFEFSQAHIHFWDKFAINSNSRWIPTH